jgi:hypothetical protein
VSTPSEAWDRLHVSGEAGQYVRLRLLNVTACAAYAARRVGDGNEALILEVGTPAIPLRPDYPQSTGLDVRPEVIVPGRSGRTRLLLTLQNQKYRDVFHSLADDVVRSLVMATGEAEAVGIFLSRLARWQSFLRKHSPTGLTLEARRGLLGELSFLLDLLPHTGSDVAVRAWKGCAGSVHDFHLPRGNVEIKTTAAHPPRHFHVSNVGQLDDSGIPALFLCHTAVEESEAGDVSLPELVDLIHGQIPPSAQSRFEENILESGFFDAHREHYASPRYHIRRKRFFRISAGFPRISADELQLGIGDISYTVDLAACAPFETDILDVFRTVISTGEIS